MTTSHRFLLVQLADIGDLIVTTPALAALRETHPEAHFTLLTSKHAAPVIEGTGLVDEVITMDRAVFASTRALLRPSVLRQVIATGMALRRGNYDTLVIFRHFSTRPGALKHAAIALASGAKRRVGLRNGRDLMLTDTLPDAGFDGKHEAQHWLDLVGLLGAESTPRRAQVNIDSAYRIPWQDSIKPGAPVVVIHPGSGGLNRARRWEPEGLAAAADHLHTQHGAQIVLVGGPEDDGETVAAALQAPYTDLTGKTTLPQLAAVLKQADLFIGADSGVMHLAAAAGARVVAIFGPTNPTAWGPWVSEGRAVILRSDPLCSPCGYVEQRVGLREGCNARTCMRMVTTAQVIAAAEKLLDQRAADSDETSTFRRPARTIPPPSDEHLRDWQRIHILGLPVDGITYAQWLDQIAVWVKVYRQADEGCQPAQVCTTNPEFIMIARKDPNFYNILSRADLCVPDGVGLLWAANWLGHPLPERVTGSDGIYRIAERAAAEGWRLYLLGAAPGIAEQTATILQDLYPGLQIAGTHSGSPDPAEEDDIVGRVNASDADVLLVAYGAPRQDKWIARNLPRLKVAMAMGVGGSFDFVTGIIPRAPLWMQRAGLEWLYRLYLQPSRIGRMTRLPRFVLAVLRHGRHA